MTIQEIIKDANQFNLSNLISKRYSSKTNGWIDLNISESQTKELARIFAEGAGGRQYTQDDIYHNIVNSNVKNCGLLERLYLSINSSGKIVARYIAGQDYAGEIKYLRNYLKK